MKAQNTTQKTTKTIPLERKLIDLLFLRLDGIYGHLWTSRHANAKAWEITKDEWGSALAGIDVSIIRNVLDELRNDDRDYPPSLPQFLKLCRKHCGLPDMEKAYQMALRRDFSHPLTEMCYEKIGSWHFTHDSEKDLRRKFKISYKEIVKQIPLNQKMLESKI